MKRQIKAAIKAAGLKVEDFTVGADYFETLLGNVRTGNAQGAKVAKALKAQGVRVSWYMTGYGAKVFELNAPAARPELTGVAHPMHY